MRIFLIGMPGCGKSNLGKQLSRKIDLPYYDLDNIIEEKEGMPINDIFNKNGEDYFREIEQIVLYDFCSNYYDRFIMATGGGTPCFASNLELMNASGNTVYLKVGSGELVNRLRNEPDKRPLFKGVPDLFQTITSLLASRSEFYDRSDVTLESDNLTADGLITALINLENQSRN